MLYRPDSVEPCTALCSTKRRIAQYKPLASCGLPTILANRGRFDLLSFAMTFRRLLQLRQDFALSLAVDVRFASILLNQPQSLVLLRLTIPTSARPPTDRTPTRPRLLASEPDRLLSYPAFNHFSSVFYMDQTARCFASASAVIRNSYSNAHRAGE